MTIKIELLPDERRTEMTNNIQLLPLPEGYDKYSHPRLYVGQMFHEGQMRAYARANSARAIAPLQAEIERLRADVAEWKARADDLAAALHNCIKLAYNRDQDELPSAIITTASKAVAKYDMLVDFSAAPDD